MRRDAQKCTEWLVLKSTESTLVLGKYDHEKGNLSRRVVIDEKLSASVHFGGKIHINTINDKEISAIILLWMEVIFRQNGLKTLYHTVMQYVYDAVSHLSGYTSIYTCTKKWLKSLLN